MEKKDKYDRLHDKFFHGTITTKERKELFEAYQDQVCLPGQYNEDLIAEFLITTHPDYGKPDKDGIITIL